LNCYLVNLARAPERLEASRKRFEAGGIPFERIEAVDGLALPPEERRAVCPPVRFYLANAHRVLPGEIGCVLSHLKCWRQAFGGGEPVAAVFEDDVEPDPPRLREAFASIEAENDSSVPTVWLLHRGLPRPAAVEGPWYDILETDDIGHVFCTPAYALNAAAARRLSAILTPMANVADAWSTYARSGVRILAAAVPCAATRGMPSTIGHGRGSWWHRQWFRRFYWFRWRMAFRLDLCLKRFEGKRFPLEEPVR